MIRLIVLLVACLASAAVAEDWSEAVCRVRVPAGGGSFDLGTGSLVEYEGHSFVLTNQHVVAGRRGNSGVYVEWPSAGVKRRALVLLQQKDDELDLAVLAVEGGRVPLRHLRMAAEIPQEPVTLYGFGGGNFLRQPARIRRSGTWAMIDAQPRSGDSGGPIATADGRLAGVVWGGGGSMPGRGLACRPTPIRNLLSRVVRGIARRPLPRNYCVGPQCQQPQYQRPQWSPSPPIERRPAAPAQQQAACDCEAWQREAEERLAALSDGQSKLIAQLGKLAESTATLAATQQTNTSQIAAINARPLPSSAEIDARLADLDSRIDGIESRPEDPRIGDLEGRLAQFERRRHYTLVADTTADYWPRVLDDYKRANEVYAGIRLAPPMPGVPGEMPRLVAYESSTPIGNVGGYRDVSQALSRIARGDKPTL